MRVGALAVNSDPTEFLLQLLDGARQLSACETLQRSAARVEVRAPRTAEKIADLSISMAAGRLSDESKTISPMRRRTWEVKRSRRTPARQGARGTA